MELHNVEVYNARPGFIITLRDLKNAAAILRERLARLRSRRITVSPVSVEWCARHERDAAKH